MLWRISSLAGVAALGLMACGGGERHVARFTEEPEADPVPVMVLRNDSSRTAEGHRVAELDVLMPLVKTEAAARATLQHVIDSVAAADTMAAAVRVTGFVMGELDVETASADLVAAMRATWGPIDEAGFTGRQRASRYRTSYVVLHPLDTTVAPERRP